MSLKGKTRTRQARYDVLKATAWPRQRALARARAEFDHMQYDGHQDQGQEPQ